nr:hypothetical protein Hi04_10k_c110_00005 [uncultured bacterium]
MNILLLQPTDVLFFRDGRPMSGSLAGHTAAWPLPDVTSHAFHAALHRAGLEGAHLHRRGQSGNYGEQRDRKFGSLLTSGPFPVNSQGRWFFPRPSDSKPAKSSCVAVTLLPIGGPATSGDLWLGSSLPHPLKYPVGSLLPPVKETTAEPWMDSPAFAQYLRGNDLEAQKTQGQFLMDADIADQEANLGIAIDPNTETAGQGTTAGMIYTAHYLRLREGFRLGLMAGAEDKGFNGKNGGKDLIRELLNGRPTQIVVGGQQRLCTAVRTEVPSTGLPLPQGLFRSSDFITLPNGKTAVKWVMLSPAVYPQIPATKKDGTAQNEHPGGWLPNWIDPQSGRVLLTAGPGLRKAARKKCAQGGGIDAHLVAALVPKPVVITGWALPNEADRPEGGAKSVQFAVPAGAVYYFEAASTNEAIKLAGALNWHGDPETTDFSKVIRNRRSTLLGEKGYGLGVCGTWKFLENVRERPNK